MEEDDYDGWKLLPTFKRQIARAHKEKNIATKRHRKRSVNSEDDFVENSDPNVSDETENYLQIQNDTPNMKSCTSLKRITDEPLQIYLGQNKAADAPEAATVFLSPSTLPVDALEAIELTLQPPSPSILSADTIESPKVATIPTALPLFLSNLPVDTPDFLAVTEQASRPLSTPTLSADATDAPQAATPVPSSRPLVPPTLPAANATDAPQVATTVPSSRPLAPPTLPAADATDAPQAANIVQFSQPLAPPTLPAADATDAPQVATTAPASRPLAPPTLPAADATDAPQSATVPALRPLALPTLPAADAADAPQAATTVPALRPLAPPTLPADDATDAPHAATEPASLPLALPTLPAADATNAPQAATAPVLRPLAPPTLPAANGTDAPQAATTMLTSRHLAPPTLPAGDATDALHAATTPASLPLASSTLPADATDSLEAAIISPSRTSSPCTSGKLRLDLLEQDLYLSNSDMSPYVDSESSYHPDNDQPQRDTDTDISDNEAGSSNNITLSSYKRSRKPNPGTWKRNKAKKLRQSGQSYNNRSSKVVGRKRCIPTDCTKCRFKCNESFPENIRDKICQNYWGLGETNYQKVYLSTLMKHGNIQRRSTAAKKNRTTARQYFLSHKATGKKRVCQKFFCNIFNISSSVVLHWAKNIGTSAVYLGDDMRKGLVPGNKTSEEDVNYVKEHIDMLPRIESHYCRKDSKKMYLESDLNQARLYNLYKEEFCKERNIKPVSMYIYSEIFKSYDPPLDFYKPKKDQCIKCNVYRYATKKEDLQEAYDEHKKREQDSLDMKSKDKEESLKSNGTMRAITFDLQAILSVPYTADSKIYYLRKYSLYNFTILDNYDNTGLCYLWDETNGKKGSTEIGSILIKYLMSLPENVTTLSSFSDTCGGQNRNKYVTLAALYAVNNISHLQRINFKYMESGHSYLEADSIHACIERARKHKKIFTAREYALVISCARSNPKPYDVNIMKYTDFYDLKDLEKSIGCNIVKNVNKEIVKWMKIKWLQVRKESPTSVFYKYNLRDAEFEKIDISINISRSKKKKVAALNYLKKPLKKAYKSLIPISKAKKKDLMTLLKDGIIPEDYAEYYRNIPANDTEIVNDISDNEYTDSD